MNIAEKDFFKKKKVLVTGGSGFIGSNLSIRLVQLGADVTVIDNMNSDTGSNLQNLDGCKEKIKFFDIDLSKTSNSELKLIGKMDVIFHLAGLTSHAGSMVDPKGDLYGNVVSTINTLNFITDRCRDSKLVFTSTRQLYGKPQYLPVDESHPINPPDVNGINKYACEQYVRLYGKVAKIKYVILRLTNTFGPRMRVSDSKQGFIGLWIKNLIENGTLKVFGDGTQSRDFLYIDDCIDAILISASDNKALYKTFNVGGEQSLMLKDLAKLMQKLAKDIDIEYVKFPEKIKDIEIGNYTGDYSKIKIVLGWQASTSLKEGLEKTLAYYEKNKDKYWS